MNLRHARYVDDAAFSAYLVDYQHEGATWCFEIRAANHADALQRLRAIQYSGELKGEIVSRIPAAAGPLGLVPRIVCWWKNRRLGRG